MTGEELKAYRQARGLTQKALGLKLGYPKNSAEKVVQQWEYDRQPIPIKHFRKLSGILDIPLEKFIP